MKKENELYSFSSQEVVSVSEKDKQTVKQPEIRQIPIGQLQDFKGHPFKVEQDNTLFELMLSIEKEGVIVPALARPSKDGKGYELIAGHRRKAASQWAGLTEIPVIVQNMDDNQAVIAMVDSNLQREHLKPSEKAFAYKMKLEAMKQQGKRNDLTSSQVVTKSIVSQLQSNRADEQLARQVGENRMTIQRYIRLTNLIPKILDMVDAEQIAFTVGVELSYLKEEEQYELHAVMDLEQCTPSLSQANRIKRLSQSEELDMDAMYLILEQEKPNQREQIKIRADVLDDYFPTNFTPKQKVDLIQQLVKEWHERQAELRIQQTNKKKERGTGR